jgi:DNA processing protein
VVSGLARGVDGIAHQSALDAGGLTIAVLASGLRNVYPARHRSLAHRIAGDDETSVAAGGLLISEYGDGDEPAHPYRFRERNRIIAALSDYLVVIQARPTSGSMITAHRALELGVPIGIVPSGPADVCYEGSTALIRDGADAVLDGATVARRLAQHGIADVDTTSLDEPTDPRITAFDVPRTSEEVAELLGISMSEARRMLRELEQLGAVCTTRDGRWARTISTAPRTNLVYNANSHEGE